MPPGFAKLAGRDAELGCPGCDGCFGPVEATFDAREAVGVDLQAGGEGSLGEPNELAMFAEGHGGFSGQAGEEFFAGNAQRGGDGHDFGEVR